MGAFTEWLVKILGIEKYLQFYKYVDVKVGLQETYQMTAEELDTDFEKYVSHHELDAALEEEMRKLEE